MRKMIVPVLVAVGATAIASCPLAAEVAFVIPVVSGFGEYSIDVDIGHPVAQVNGVYFAATGTCRAAGLTSYRIYDEPQCDAPEWVPRDCSVMVQSGAAAAYGYYYWQMDGSFAISDTLAYLHIGDAGHLFADGRATITIMEGNSDTNYQFYHCVLPRETYCHVCAEGLLEFGSYPELIVSYDPAVPTSTSSWGTVKACYR